MLTVIISRLVYFQFLNMMKLVYGKLIVSSFRYFVKAFHDLPYWVVILFMHRWWSNEKNLLSIFTDCTHAREISHEYNAMLGWFLPRVGVKAIIILWLSHRSVGNYDKIRSFLWSLYACTTSLDFSMPYRS